MALRLEIFLRFLGLGLLCFGGPIAHLGYFEALCVRTLRWVDHSTFARMIALSQLLPGPSSSQVGFSIGLKVAGVSGAIAAFIGFTLPSFLLMYGLSVMNGSLLDSEHVARVIHGLKVFAAVVVADAVRTMTRTSCREPFTRVVMVLTAMVCALSHNSFSQILCMFLAGAAGAWFSSGEHIGRPQAGRWNLGPLLLWLALWGVAAFAIFGSVKVQIFATFYKTGSLVFGGGHVVLPLLESMTSGQISADRFLFGYTAAQMIPGPMFTLATFLGAEMLPDHPLLGAFLATAGIFLPGFLLVMGMKDKVEAAVGNRSLAGMFMGINAAVVGLLAAALWHPLLTHAMTGVMDVLVFLAGCAVLRRYRLLSVLLVPVYGMWGLWAV